MFRIFSLLLIASTLFAEPADWIWSARYVITGNARRAVIANGAVAIRAERIVGVGTRAEIDARGQVGNITVAQGLGLGLDERAIAAVQKWKFRAGMRNGKPVATPALIYLTFRLL